MATKIIVEHGRKVILKRTETKLYAKRPGAKIFVKCYGGANGNTTSTKTISDYGTVGTNPVGSLKIITKINDLLSLANNTDVTIDNVIGLSIQAGTSGNLINYLKFGEINNAAFGSLTVGPAFLSTNGNITSTAPDTGWLLQVGTYLGNNLFSVLIDPATAIWRGL